MKKKALAAVAVAACMSMALVGCGGGGEQKQEGSDSSSARSSETTPIPIHVEEYGYNSHDGYIEYAAVLSNENAQWLANYPAATVTGYDKNGDVVFSQDESLQFLAPDQKGYIVGLAEGKGVKEIEVEASVDDSNWEKETEMNGEAVDALLEVSKTKVNKDEYGGASVTGKVTSGYDEQISAVRVVAILRDKDGEIVGGDFGFVDNLGAGATKAFDVDIPELPKGFAKAEVYASYWY